MQSNAVETVRPAGQKARFLFVAPRFHTNQVPVVRTLTERGHPMRFLARYVGAVESHAALQPDLAPLRATKNRGERLLEQTQRQWPRLGPLWRYLNDFRPDVTIIRDFGAYTDWAVMAWLLSHRRKFLLYTQGAKYRRSFTWRQRLAARVMVRWLGGGWFTPVLYREGPQPHTLEELDFVPLIFEPDPGLAKDWSAWRPEAPLRLLCIGKYARYKNHPLVLRAVAHPAIRDRVRLTVIGECSIPEHEEVLSRCRALVRELKLEDRVELHTSVPYEEVQREYRRHEMLVLGSNRESCAMVILESMGYGVPPVSGDWNGSACYINPGFSGFVFRSGDEASLVRTLHEALDRRMELPTMSARAQQVIREKCSPDAYYEALKSVVERRLRLTL